MNNRQTELVEWAEEVKWLSEHAGISAAVAAQIVSDFDRSQQVDHLCFGVDCAVKAIKMIALEE